MLFAWLPSLRIVVPHSKTLENSDLRSVAYELLQYQQVHLRRSAIATESFAGGCALIESSSV